MPAGEDAYDQFQDALIEDETGRLNLKLWRNQVDLVRVGDIIKIENGFAVEFGGATEIDVGSRGRITVVKRYAP